SHTRRSERSSSAMIASCEVELMAFWILAALPPRPAVAEPAKANSATDATRSWVRILVVMVILLGVGRLLDRVLARVELAAVVRHGDEQVVLVGGQLVAHRGGVRRERRGVERADVQVLGRVLLDRVELLDELRTARVAGL